MIDPYSTPTIGVVHNISTTLRVVAQNDTSTLHRVVHSTNYTFHSMVWPISSWKHGLGWFVIGNSSNIHKTNCQLRFHCYVSTINSKFTDSLIKILSWLFFYEPSSNINFSRDHLATTRGPVSYRIRFMTCRSFLANKNFFPLRGGGRTLSGIFH